METQGKEKNKVIRAIDWWSDQVMPWKYFEDASQGKPLQRWRAAERNKANKNKMIPVINGWAQASASLFIMLGAAESNIAKPWGALQAALVGALGVGTAVSITICVTLAVIWTQLTWVKVRLEKID